MAFGLSFFDVPITMNHATFVGWDNFVEAFHDPRFINSLKVTAIFTGIEVPVQVLGALVIAAFISKNNKRNKFLRAVYFLPVICSATVIGIMWRMILHSNIGFITAALQSMGLGKINFMNTPGLTIFVISFISIWRSFGISTIIYVTAIQQVSPSLFEAAQMDGAGKILQFLHITVPSIRPTFWYIMMTRFVNPADFIPLAEYLGLINPIGEYVMRNAALRCKYWNDMGHPEYHVNVNLSVVQLLQNDIVKKVAKVLEETRIIPQNLTLEVTESLAINDMVRMKKILSEIRNLGVRVALDDFGTGYSSLNHIREMPLDVIKIDRCFIEHLGEDDFSNAFVRMVSELANAINVRVCVEGVETKRQRDIVKKMGIRMIQGFFYGKPMKIEEFEKKYLI